MTDKKKSTNSAFSQQQRAQISNACERVQNAININNSTLAKLNADLIRKADEIAIKWRAYGLPYNAICDAVIEMAIWQKEQMLKNVVETKVRGRIDGKGIFIDTDIPIGIDVYEDEKVKVIIVKEDEKCSTE